MQSICLVYLSHCGLWSGGRWTGRSLASWSPWRCVAQRWCCHRCRPSPWQPHHPARRFPGQPPGGWRSFWVSPYSKRDLLDRWMDGREWLITVKVLGRVLLHLQCCGTPLQRKLGLSVCTRPLGGAVLCCWRDRTSWSSRWRLVGDGVGRRFTTGSDGGQKTPGKIFILIYIIFIYILYFFVSSEQQQSVIVSEVFYIKIIN